MRQENSVQIPFSMSILSFMVKLAPDGLPMLGDWMTVAKSIWVINYEGWREPFEIKPADSSLAPGAPVQYGSLEVVKGCGRLSILLFSIFYTYMEFKNQLSDEELESFKQPLD